MATTQVARALERLARCAFALALMSAGGCHDRGPTEPEPATPRELPPLLVMEGSASSTEADGSTVACSLELILELSGSPSVTPSYLEYQGVHGGAIQRTVLDAQGDGISLWPHVFGEVFVRSHADGEVEVLIPVNATTESRFWKALSRLEGRFDGEATASGGWDCAPFDITEGWADVQYTARGRWTMRPQNP